MPEPGLSEIVNMSVDSERGTGTPAVVFDSKPLIAQINQAAQFKAENDWKKYNMFLGNLKDVYKDMNEIAKMPVMTKDRDALKEQMAGIVKSIASDPHGFFGGGAKYQETLANIAKLQSDATESKQNNLYDEAHRNYFYRNPELDTPENRSLVDGYVNQKLGSRQPYLMKLPGLFDAKAIGSEISALIKDSGADEKPTADNQFLEQRKWEKYDPNKFRATAEQFLYQADKRGIPLYETMAKRYEKLPESVKQQYAKSADPVKDFYLDSLSVYRPQDTESKNLVSNPGYLEKEKLAAQKWEASLRASVAREGNFVDMMKNGYVPDKNSPGGWKYEGKGLLPTNSVGEVKYWDTYIRNQIPEKEKNFNGDVDATTDQISGLSVVLEGEKSTDEGKGIGLFNAADNKPQPIKIRYKDGAPQGVVIGGQYFDSKEFDRKATQVQNRSMTNKGIDTPVFGNTISIYDLPIGASVETKNGKNYYQGKEVTQ
jgi:hypothetical protein